MKSGCAHEAFTARRGRTTGSAVVTALVIVVSTYGCQAPGPSSKAGVDRAWVERSGKPASAKRESARPAQAPPKSVADQVTASNNGVAIAYVDGKPIDRQTLVNLLIAGHGVGIFEQLVVLERARQKAEELGVRVSEKDVVAEHERSLRALLSPIEAADESSANPPEFNHEEAERLLDEIIARRNVSRAEYRAVMTRNAYLRAIVEATMSFTEAQLKEEYALAFGERVRIRHIQLPSLLDAERISANLARGADFTEQARDYSANLRTAPAGGLLPDFTRDDPRIPEGLRQIAFGLTEGEVSNCLHVDDWYHIVKLEKRVSAENPAFEEVRGVLEDRLRERLATPAMQTLYRSLFEQADIRIEDPILRQEFERKHPDRLKP